MATYEALTHHLRDLKRNQIELGFSGLQQIIGRPLPKAAKSPSWWSNDAAAGTSNGRSRAWLQAEFNAELLPSHDRVSFVRHGYRIVWRNADTIWLERDNVSEEEQAEARRAAEGLIRSIARVTAMRAASLASSSTWTIRRLRVTCSARPSKACSNRAPTKGRTKKTG